VCEKFGLTIGQSEQGAKAVFKRKGVTNPTIEQLKQAKEKTVEDFLLYFSYTWLIVSNMGRLLRKLRMPYCRKRTCYPKM